MMLAIDPVVGIFYGLVVLGGAGAVWANRQVKAGARYVAAHQEHGPLKLAHLPSAVARLGREARLMRVALEGISRQLTDFGAASDDVGTPTLLLSDLQVQMGTWLRDWDALDPQAQIVVEELGVSVAPLRQVLLREADPAVARSGDSMGLGDGLLVGSGTGDARGVARVWRRWTRREYARQVAHLQDVLHCLVEIEQGLQRTSQPYR